MHSLVRVFGFHSDLVGKTPMRITSGPRIDDARKAMTDVFLEHSEREWLVMVDSDSAFHVEDFKAFLDRLSPRFPIVSGSIWMVNQSSGETFSPHQVRNEDGQFEKWDPFNEDGSPKTGYHPIAIGGGACLAVHRDVFLKMQELEDESEDEENNHFPRANAWWSHLQVGVQQENGSIRAIEVGEDYSFCLRAEAMGIPVVVDADLVVAHSKLIAQAGVPQAAKEIDYVEYL